MPSSPGSELFRTDKLQMGKLRWQIFYILAHQMRCEEVPQMPRSSRVGGAREKPSLAEQGNKYVLLLYPYLCRADGLFVQIVGFSPTPRASSSKLRTTSHPFPKITALLSAYLYHYVTPWTALRARCPRGHRWLI